MNILKLLNLILIAIMILQVGCKQQNPPVTAVDKPSQNRVKIAFTHRDFSTLRSVASGSLLELDNMGKANRENLFKLLASGDSKTIESRLDYSALLFFDAVRYIEGNHNSSPTNERLIELYSYWEDSGGDFDIFLTMWERPVIEGFKLIWIEDLPDKTENGRLMKGWRIKNTGDVAWPKSLELEPLMTNPEGGIAIETLPKAVKVPGIVEGETVLPGETIDIYVDITDISLAIESGVKLYFISTFEDESKHRHNIHPRPKSALGEFPDLLFISL